MTSSIPGEGKTTTAVNLALCFGLDVGSTTCLVDGDLRTPSVHRAFAKLPQLGLGELLESEEKLDDALLQVPDTRLTVLPVKSRPLNPAELVASPKMGKLVEELASRFDTVVVDAPPLLGLPDAVSLADLCDAALFVVGAGRASRSDVEAALERLERTRLIGTVFNRCDPDDALSSHHYLGGGGATHS